MSKTITHAQLLERLHYDQETGQFSRKTAVRGHLSGPIQRKLDKKGYRIIRAFGTEFRAYRLAWFYVHGVLPTGQVDHINGVRDDNRIVNLRDVSPSENQQNRRGPTSANKCGFLGVFAWQNKWRSRIKLNGRAIEVGMFDSPEAAHAAYLAKKRELHPGCTI